MNSAQHGHITLKWGTLKAWNVTTDKGKELLSRYAEIGASGGAMTQQDTPEQVEIICGLIDECDDPEGIFLDWDGRYVTKDEAKEYVRNYDKHGAAA